MLCHCQSDGLGTQHKPAYCCRPSLHNQSTLADDPLSPALFTEAPACYATASQMALEHITNLLQQHVYCYRPTLHNQFTEAVERYATASQKALNTSQNCYNNMLIPAGRLCTTSPPWQTTP